MTVLPTYAPVAWGAAPLACNACHLSTTLASGSHTKHLASDTNCGSCHTGATATTYASTSHVDTLIDVTAALSYTNQGAAGNGYSTCATNSCHNNGTTGAQVPTAAWGATVAACTACHALVPATGAHAKHVTTTAFKKTLCIDCHAGAVSGSNAGANHLNNNVDVAAGGYPASTAKHAAGTYAGNCSTVYCHSSGQGTANGVTVLPTYAPIAWGTAGPLACNVCHLSTTLASGSHAPHLASSTNCGNCHTGATATTYASTAHVDTLIDVAAGFGYTNQGAAGNGYSSCSGTANGCHGSVTTLPWGVSTSSASCTKCHGKATPLANYSASAQQAAPGYAQSAGGPYTNGVSATAAYGAHDAHVRAVNQYTTREVLCTDCHGALPPSGSHASGATNFAWSNMAKNVGTTFEPRTAPLSPSYSAGSCSAVYCHGDGGVFLGTQGTDPTPQWTNQTYLTPYAKNATNCGKCHAALPVVPKKDHSAIDINNATSCNTCHAHDGKGATHIDGLLQANGDCNGCHDYDSVGSVWTGATTNRYTTTGTWGKNAIAAGNTGFGAHAQHINYIKSRLSISTQLDPANQTYGVGDNKYICGTCHTTAETKHNSALDPNRSINFGEGAFMMAPSHATLSKTLLFVSGTNPAYSTVARTCSNLSCHYFTSPAWSN